MNEPLTPSNANRLAIGLARYRGIPYAEAAQILRSLSLRIVANTTACSRVAGQAAVLTAINTAHRAFLGGVEFIVPEAVPLLLPIPGVKSLREAIALTGCTPVSLAKQTHTVFIGNPSGDNPWDDVLVHCDGWRGGSSDLGAPAQFEIGDADDFALGGIFGGASAVHRCFVRATGMPANCLNAPCGFSLWAPGSEWLKPEGQRHLFNIPIHFWMLGLGHLGQGFLWNLAILPHSSREDVLFLLNDFDSIEETNLGSGLLCTRTSVGQKKARYCAAWLEKFGFATTVCERPFGPDTKRTGKEPAIAFCGFDKAEPRTYIDTAGFGLVLECGLGAGIANFDDAQIHVFPNAGESAAAIWASQATPETSEDAKMASLFAEGHGACGQIALDIAGKSVSTSFVGAMAGAMTVAELLRRFNKGVTFDRMDFNARCASDFSKVDGLVKIRASELGAMGYRSLDSH